MNKVNEQKQPEFVAVPIGVFNVVNAILGNLPYDQVAEVISKLRACQPITMVKENETKKDTDQ